MNVLRIAIKEMKVAREARMLVFMLATPVLLILILGTALTNAFNGNTAIGDIRVLYHDSGTDPALTKEWESFKQESENSLGILFEQASEGIDGQQEVRNNRYTGYVEIGGNGIHYKGNSRSSIENGIMQGMLSAFTDRYRLAAEVAKIHPEYESKPLAVSDGGGYVKETSIQGAKQPGSLDYFAIAVTTMIILYSALTAGGLIESERKRNTAQRLLASPVTKAEIFAGKILGNLMINAVFVMVVVFISKYMFNANWGDNLAMVFAVLFTEILFALSLGLGISYVLKGNAAGSVIMIIIQLAAFVGGGYTPVASTTGFMREAAAYSPLHWSNEALLQIIYSDNGAAALNAMMLNVGFSVLLLAVAMISMRRREGL
ncbi:ABC transporter permease [Paenibacillus sp. DMB20]|uniref:ABC transporter permease n=1 Tax=Paenibacillus sp. DMB20 TaxID=1642570 RepID=UPI00062763FB|nr:ABC transporter permease [Paenibacillus sp. DMB20]KKO55350.1 ABC transporter [Paenibacillus sp. DMB20]